MSSTILTGPSLIIGPLGGLQPYPQDYSIEFGPSLEYQGDAIPDVRSSVPLGNVLPGSIPSHLNSPYFLMTDGVPSGQQALTVAGNATNGTALTNISTAAAGATLNVPFYQFNTQTLISNAICLDFGWGTLNVTASSVTATPSSGTLGLYYQGQWLVIGNVGNVGGTIPLITQVASVGTTSITLTNAPLATSTTAPVGSGNIFTTLFGASVATAHSPYLAAGVLKLLDPKQTLMRGVCVTGVAGGTGGGVLIKGYDIYGQPQSELITAGAGATTTYGKKTYKWFLSATPQFSDAHNYTVQTSDTFGFACRSDLYEYTDLFYAGSFQTTSGSTTSQWIAGDQTSPATTTTGDVRGTFQVSARGATAGVTSTNYANGSNRVSIFMTVPLYNLISATPANPVPLYGVTPV